jgi:hypothetical protein
MKLGEKIRAELVSYHKERYRVLKEIQAPTIIRLSERKALRRWQDTKRQPVPGFKKLQNLEVLGEFDDKIPKCRGLWKILTEKGWVYFRKGRWGCYLEMAE